MTTWADLEVQLLMVDISLAACLSEMAKLRAKQSDNRYRDLVARRDQMLEEWKALWTELQKMPRESDD